MGNFMRELRSQTQAGFSLSDVMLTACRDINGRIAQT